MALATLVGRIADGRSLVSRGGGAIWEGFYQRRGSRKPWTRAHVASTEGTGPPHTWTFISLRLIRAALPSVVMLIPLTLAAVLGCIDQGARRPLGFHVAMVIAVLLLFSLAHSVQAYYVLPALPSLAIVISGVFALRSGPAGAKQTTVVRFRDVPLAGICATMLILILVRGGTARAVAA